MNSKPSSAPVEKFVRFCKLIGLKLEDFQLRIVEDLFAKRREALILIPRGNGKSTLLAALALFHLLSRPDAKIAVGAASREQAGVLFEIARNMAQHPAIAPKVAITRREIRSGLGWLKVVASDGPKQHGLDLTLAIVDELHAHHDDELYIALRTGLLKRPDAQLWTITTAGIGEESALGTLRARARQLPEIEQNGFLTRAAGPNLVMLEWSLPDDANIEDMGLVKQVNPASWIDEQALEEQRDAVHEIAFRRYHANQWVAAKAPWITGDVWDACNGKPQIPVPSDVVLGVDASIVRDSTCVATVRRDSGGVFHAEFRIWTPSRGREVQMEDVMDFIRSQGEKHNVQTMVFDPQFMHHAAQMLEREGMNVFKYPQNNAMMVPATRALHEAVVHQKLRHGGHEIARSHALAAEVWETERGIRMMKTRSQGNIDSTIALAMAVEYASRGDGMPKSRYSDPNSSLVAA